MAICRGDTSSTNTYAPLASNMFLGPYLVYQTITPYAQLSSPSL